MLFSIMVLLIYTCICVLSFLFLHIFIVFVICVCVLYFDNNHSDWGEMISHCDFGLYFPDG
jgi:hypothetical protein